MAFWCLSPQVPKGGSIPLIGFDAIAADLAILFLSGVVLLPVATVLSKRTM
jgi:hypothetical protein